MGLGGVFGAGFWVELLVGVAWGFVVDSCLDSMVSET